MPDARGPTLQIGGRSPLPVSSYNLDTDMPRYLAASGGRRTGPVGGTSTHGRAADPVLLKFDNLVTFRMLPITFG